MVDKTDTIRVWEPDPKTPAVNLPRGADRKLVLRAVGRTLVATVMTLGGIVLFFAGIGVAAPVFVLYGGVVLALRARAAIVDLRANAKWHWHPELEFEHADVDALVGQPCGKAVAARLPDGRWLHFTLSAGSRTQLAGQRRLWLIRNGHRAIVVLPGAPAARFGHLNDEPIAGAAELPVVSRELVQLDEA